MRGKKNTDHVTFCPYDGAMKCAHCEGSYIVNLPIALELIAVIGKTWVKMHKNCKAPKPINVKTDEEISEYINDHYSHRSKDQRDLMIKKLINDKSQPGAF